MRIFHVTPICTMTAIKICSPSILIIIIKIIEIEIEVEFSDELYPTIGFHNPSENLLNHQSVLPQSLRVDSTLQM